MTTFTKVIFLEKKRTETLHQQLLIHRIGRPTFPECPGAPSFGWDMPLLCCPLPATLKHHKPALSYKWCRREHTGAVDLAKSDLWVIWLSEGQCTLSGERSGSDKNLDAYHSGHIHWSKAEPETKFIELNVAKQSHTHLDWCETKTRLREQAFSEGSGVQMGHNLWMTRIAESRFHSTHVTIMSF